MATIKDRSVSGFELTDANYYSVEAGQHYLSNSMLSDFFQCPAAAQAHHVTDTWHPPSRLYFLAGQLFHLYVLEPHLVPSNPAKSQFAPLHNKTGKTAGQLNSYNRWIPEAAGRLRRQPVMQEILDGAEVEKIFTGEIAGLPFRCKVDALTADGHVLFDAKSARSIDDYWDKPAKMYLPWFEKYNYPRQFAIYRELVRQNTGIAPQVVVGAVTKDTVPDVWIKQLHGEPDRWKLELDDIAEHADEIKRWWSGELGQRRCGKCDYCKDTHVVETLDVLELG